MRITQVLATTIALWGLSGVAVHAQSFGRATDDEIQDIVYLASDRPVFLRLRIRVVGQGFRGLRAAYAKRLFQSLDRDGDGRLDSMEMSRIPPAEELMPPRRAHDGPRKFNSAPVDADSDGIVTLPELIEYVKLSTGKPFVITVAAPIHAGKVHLFEAIDVDRDGTLSQNEIQAAGRAILKFDANDDEIVDQTELMLDQPGAVGAGSTTPVPELLTRLLAVDRESAAAQDALFAKLVERYDKPRRPADPNNDRDGDGRLDAAELGVSPTQFARWDADGDGTLEGAEGRSYLLDPIPNLEISAPLGNGPPVSVAPPSSDSEVRAASLQAVSGKRGNLQLTIGSADLDLVTGQTASPAAEVRRLFDKKFDAADGDANEYLDMAEMRRLNLSEVVFSMIDSNDDNMVRKEELLEYAELQRVLFSGRVVLSLSQEAQSILDLIDEGADDHLGLREILGVPAHIRDWDLNGDGRIEPGEIPVNSRLILQNEETTLFRGVQARSQRQSATPRSAIGPLWFQKMDRNHDGDLSPREFLGPLGTFQRLDKNSDGLLSASEAENRE
jgi:Ca2+-binding EF-hand superfamily protein